MLGLLREDLAEQGITNVDVVESEWLDAQVTPADVVICSHVLYPIADPVPFIEKLNGSARARVFIYLRTDPLATDLGLWRAFHGIPLQSQPVHTDLMGLLSQMGIFAGVEIVEHRFTWTFADLDEAHEQLRNSLCLRADDDAASAKLRSLLERDARRVAGRAARAGVGAGTLGGPVVDADQALVSSGAARPATQAPGRSSVRAVGGDGVAGVGDSDKLAVR